MTNAKDKAWYVWTEINKSDEELAKELTEGVEPSRLHANSVRFFFMQHSFIYKCIVTWFVV